MDDPTRTFEVHPHATNDTHLRAGLVVTLHDGKITAMQDYRRGPQTIW